jgi:hypothetical protein
MCRFAVLVTVHDVQYRSINFATLRLIFLDIYVLHGLQSPKEKKRSKYYERLSRYKERGVAML